MEKSNRHSVASATHRASRPSAPVPQSTDPSAPHTAPSHTIEFDASIRNSETDRARALVNCAHARLNRAHYDSSEASPRDGRLGTTLIKKLNHYTGPSSLVEGTVHTVRNWCGQSLGSVIVPTYPRNANGRGKVKIEPGTDAAPLLAYGSHFGEHVFELHDYTPIVVTNTFELANIADAAGLASLTVIPGGTERSASEQKAHMFEIQSDLSELLCNFDLGHLYIFAFDTEVAYPIEGFDGMGWLMEDLMSRDRDVCALYLPPKSWNEESRELRFARLLLDLMGH